jgi:hypothetical protein
VLELRGPVLQVLHLVEQNVGLLAVVCCLVQALAEHVVGEPRAQIQDGHGESTDLRDLVELQSEDPTRRDTVIQELLDDLLEQGCLADLPRAPQDDGGRQSMREP